LIMALEQTTTGNASPASAAPGLTPLITGIVNDAQALIRQQLTLFQTEIKNDMRRTKEATIPLIIGGVVALVAGIFVCLALAHYLMYLFPTMPPFCGYGTVGLVLAIVGGVLLYTGKAKFDSFSPLPEKAVEGLKENIQWKTKT